MLGLRSVPWTTMARRPILLLTSSLQIFAKGHSHFGHGWRSGCSIWGNANYDKLEVFA
jgi:hypothetical protein